MKQKTLDIGQINEVVVVDLDHQGAWLDVAGERLLLPKQELVQPLSLGDSLRVFIYRDQDAEIQATLKLPLAIAGEFAALRVKKILAEGVLFDLGRGFELPVAIDEIPFRPKQSERTLVRVELDEDENLCGSCRISDFLESAQGLKVGQQVELQVWRTTDLGVKMIIDNRYEGLLYADEPIESQVGQTLVGFVARLREDGKIDLSLNPGGKAGADIGRDKILQALAGSGFLPLNDSSSPEDIRRLLGLSKKQFKRAVGSLYKQNKIELLQTGIKLKG
jgi:predicted RNA-binding protein (virulence factor B family)